VAAIPHISSPCCQPRNCIGEQSRVARERCQPYILFAIIIPSIIPICTLYSKLATALFDVWSRNGYVTRVLHSSAGVGACYITRRRGQVSLNPGCTVYLYVLVGTAGVNEDERSGHGDLAPSSTGSTIHVQARVV
jgi:hypothetical protein